MTNNIVWSRDDDHYIGPFTYHKARDRVFVVCLTFGDGGERPACYARFQIGKHTVLFRIPRLVKPWRKWVDTSHYAWSQQNPDAGYWETGSHHYGFKFYGEGLHYYYGAETGSSATTKSGVWFYPWQALKLIAEDKGEQATFTVQDFDGEIIEATCCLDTRVYRVGRNAWHWVMLGKRKTFRSLDVEFFKEQGPRKGSWKGGTIASHSPADPNHSLAQAFRAYCDKNNLTIVSSLAEVTQ